MIFEDLGQLGLKHQRPIGYTPKANGTHITIDGPVVTIRDDGHGMDFDTLRRARRLGASDKGRQFNVGFRGIGIYAAFGMCETLTIHTHQTDTSELLGLRMRFGEMSRVLEREHQTGLLTAGPPSEKFAIEPDAPIDVKECCGIGLSSVGRRRPRERHSV